MSNKFPNLSDTNFPDISNVNVYDYKNNFDYTRWGTITQIHVCKVLWNNDYQDVVKFKDDAARDAYFTNLDSTDINLPTAYQVTPNISIKVPIPYNIAVTYNYLWVDVPIMTSDNDPLNYESTARVTKFYYFINSCEQVAPSTTIMSIQLDNWTTYINSIQIPYIILQRGHAPMAQIDVDTYLSSPINNTKYLLAPDYDYGEEQDIVASSTFVPINNGNKFILLAFTMSLSQLKNITYPSAVTAENTMASYSNSSDRKGYQSVVSNYDWNIGGLDYSSTKIQTESYQTNDNIIPNNACIIGVAAGSAQNLFENIQANAPFLFKSIRACYMIDDTNFTKGDSFSIYGTTVYKINKNSNSIISNISLSKDDFGFDDNYKNITKLYTFPYSRIEVTDNNGNKKEIHIENISNSSIMKDVSIAYPYISIQIYLTGINGTGNISYKWNRLNDDEITKQIYSDDFGEFLWKWDIPTYALFVNNYEQFKADNFANQYIKRYNAIKDYQKTVYSSNTSYQNEIDSSNNTKVMTDNSADTELFNANRSADTTYNIASNAASTAKSNAYDSANAAKSNAYDSAGAAQSNANASANTAQTNADNTADLVTLNTGISTAASATITARSNTMKAATTNDNNGLNTANQAWDAGLTRAVTDAENTATTVSGVANAATSVTQGVGNALGSLASGNALGAIGNIINGAASAADSGISTWAAVCKNSTVAEATISNTESKLAELNNNNSGVYEVVADCNTDNTSTSNTAQTSQASNSASTQKTNAANTSTTLKANASRTYTMSTDNADRTLTMTKGNADRTYNNSIANAKASQSTSKSNASATNSNTKTNAVLNNNTSVTNSGCTRDTAVTNAQILMEQKRIENQEEYATHMFESNTQIGTDSGDYTLDAMERRGLQIKIRTQRKGDIAQAGDAMLRFGYALNQMWNVHASGLNLMKYFTYWKAEDIWINMGDGVNQDAQNDIRNAFLNGVTVWNDPDKIGKVSIYDNQQ